MIPLEVLSVMCNSVVGNARIELFKGEHIPISRNEDGLCILKFNDQRKSLVIPEKELYSCGFIVNDKVSY